jgi:hypothetical protein
MMRGSITRGLINKVKEVKKVHKFLRLSRSSGSRTASAQDDVVDRNENEFDEVTYESHDQEPNHTGLKDLHVL